MSFLFRGFSLHFDTQLTMKALLMGILATVGLTVASSLQSLPDTAVAEPLRLLLEVSCQISFQRNKRFSKIKLYQTKPQTKPLSQCIFFR